MAHRSHDHRSLSSPLPPLSAGEWLGVQRALRAVGDGACAHGEAPGPLRRGIARIMPRLHARRTSAAAPELQPLRDFLCETARHGPAVDALAQRLESLGYSPAQIAALALIAG